ncbi:hypothetical protein CEXT_305011 [Caerostris extrusa]|uniref:Uncharacterized protein n=1 Tax=Caerostris extrusa TaxID=172846 RepID=A0AAV4Y4J9_CAEEX|nr:hypothetical protein CEXT_305011 [Caerostris extrusa]
MKSGEKEKRRVKVRRTISESCKNERDPRGKKKLRAIFISRYKNFMENEYQANRSWHYRYPSFLIPIKVYQVNCSTFQTPCMLRGPGRELPRPSVSHPVFPPVPELESQSGVRGALGWPQLLQEPWWIGDSTLVLHRRPAHQERSVRHSKMCRVHVAVHLPAFPGGGHPDVRPPRPVVPKTEEEVVRLQTLTPQHLGAAHPHPPPELPALPSPADRAPEVHAQDSSGHPRGLTPVHSLPARTGRRNLRKGLQVLILLHAPFFFRASGKFCIPLDIRKSAMCLSDLFVRKGDAPPPHSSNGTTVVSPVAIKKTLKEAASTSTRQEFCREVETVANSAAPQCRLPGGGVPARGTPLHAVRIHVPVRPARVPACPLSAFGHRCQK